MTDILTVLCVYEYACFTSLQVAREVALLEVEACRLEPYNCLVMRDKFQIGGWRADLDTALKFTLLSITHFIHPA